MVDIPTEQVFEFDLGGKRKKYVRANDEKLMAHYRKWLSAKQAQRREREREFENLRMYCGVDNSQLPGAIQSFLRQEARGVDHGQFTHFGQYNLLRLKINGIAGSIIRNPFDATFVADDESQTELTMALQEAYMSDKELMDWQAEDSMVTTLGLVYRGTLRMYVKNTFPASPMGNIAIECMPPGTTIDDPDWITTSSKDMKNHWTLALMTMEEIKERWPMKRDIISREEWLMANGGNNYEAKKNVDWNRNVDDVTHRHGNLYLVVQHNYLKKEKIDREFDARTGTVFWEWMSDEQKKDLAIKNGIGSEDIKKITLHDNVAYTYTFAPGLSLSYALDDYKDEFQLGRLPYFPWTTTRMNGKPVPMVDQLRDAQVEINKRQSTITLAAETSINGHLMVDAAIFGMDKKKMDDFVKNRNNPQAVSYVKAGASRQFPNAVQEVGKQQIPPDLFGIVNEMVDLMDRLVPQPAASEGRTERSGESGILFAHKVEVAKTMQSTMLASRRQLWNDLGEAYFFMAKQLYSKGRRTFTDGKGLRKMTINNPVTLGNGEDVVVNDFSGLARHRVVISEAPAGVNNRLMQRELNATLAQHFAQLAPNTSMSFMENVVNSLDLDEIKKQEAIESVALDRRRLQSETEAAIANAEVMKQQARAAAQPAGGPPGGGGAPEPGGAPTSPGGPLPVGGESVPQLSGEQPELSSGLTLARR